MLMRRCCFVLSIAFAGLICQSILAQEKSSAKVPAKPTLPDSVVRALNWRSIGPANMSGRITSFAVYEKDPTIWWASTASGGLLKTTNNGVSFVHQFDHEATVSIGDVEVAQSDANIVWVGTGEANPRNSVSWGDGVYKSIDGGKTWKNMGLKAAFQIGRIAIHPQNPEIVYVGALGRLWGPSDERGLYKTTDGGKTWQRVLYVDDQTGVVDVQMDPKHPETLLIATYRRERDGFDSNDPAVKFGDGAGIYLTNDGGKKFRRITKGLPAGKLGRIGISYYRRNPQHVYAIVESEKIGQVPADFPYMGIRGEDADVGMRITEVTAKGPAEKAGLKVGDIVIAVDGQTVHSYAELLVEIRKRSAGDKVKLEASRDRKSVTLEFELAKRPAPRSRRGQQQPESPAEKLRAGSPFAASLGGQAANAQDQQGKAGFQYGGVYRSTDGGVSWARINSVDPRPMYYSQIRVDPSDERFIWVLGTQLYLSQDGGKTFSSSEVSGQIHPDNHAMWVDPRDGRHVIIGNDGGIYVSYDRGAKWDHHNHVAIGQFYHVALGPRRDYHVYGGLQDNGSWGGPNRAASGSGPVNTDWIRIGGGDGFVCAVDRDDADLIYSESQGGATGRINLRTGEQSRMRPRAPRGTVYRFNWKTPFVLSPHNPKIFYSAGNYVFRSPYEGNDLKAISPEIAATNKGTASALAESYTEEGVLYAGTTDGAFWITRDGGHDWTNIYGKADKKTEKVAEEAEEKKQTAKQNAATDAAVKETKGHAKKPAKPASKPAEKTEETSKKAAAEKTVAAKTRSTKQAGRQPEVKDSPASKPATVIKDVVSGNWKGRLIREGIPADRSALTVILRMDPQGKVSGSIESQMMRGSGQGKYDPKTKEVVLSVQTERSTIEVSGTIRDTTLSGQFDVNNGTFTIEFEAKRTGDAPAATAQEPAKKVAPGKLLADLIPGPRWISSIEPSHFKKERVYISLDGHRSNDDHPYVLVSEDYGETWRSLVANLPANVGSTRVVREDIDNENLLYLGTEFGIWVSIDRGASWTRLNNNLPTVAVHEVAIHRTAGEIVAATHGRSLWILDVAALRQTTAETLAEAVHLYKPQAAVKWRQRPSRGSAGTRQFVGQNPPSGAMIYYWLAKDAAEVELEISDIEGKVLRSLEGKTEAGMHVVNWDLRQQSRASRGGRRSYGGRSVDAGKYLVTLTVDDQHYKQVVEVEDDPDTP